MGAYGVSARLFYQVAKLKVTGQKKPVMVCLFLTNRCNLRCKYCFVINKSIDQKILDAEYSREEAFKIVDDFHDLGMRLMFLAGGEPLVHKQIGDIVNHIVDKGILLHILTNGTLVEKKLDEIKRAHALCFSLDGVGEVNDCLRGAHVYDKAMAGIEKAKSIGMKCRIHSVISRANLFKLHELAQRAKELGVTLTVSPPNHLGESPLEETRITDEEYKDFWKRYEDLKRQGYPIGNSYTAIKIMRDWPLGFHEMMNEDTPVPAGYKKPVRCVNAEMFIALGAEGTLYHCIQLGVLNGPNIHEVGVKKAWETVVATRPPCVACASMNTVENSLALRLNPEMFITSLKFQLLNK